MPDRPDTDAALAAVERIDDARLAWASDPEINRADLADDLADALAFYLPKIRRALAAQPERVGVPEDVRALAQEVTDNVWLYDEENFLGWTDSGRESGGARHVMARLAEAILAQPKRVEGDPDLRRNCPVCRKPQEGSYAGVPGDKAARVYWHADGSPDGCQPERAVEPPDAELVARLRAERDSARRFADENVTWLGDRCASCGHRIRPDMTTDACPQCNAAMCAPWNEPEVWPEDCDCDRCKSARAAGEPTDA